MAGRSTLGPLGRGVRPRIDEEVPLSDARSHRPRPWLATVALLAWIGTAAGQDAPTAPPPSNSPTPSEPTTRRLPVGPMTLPFYSPSWLGGDGWPRFDEVLAEGDRVGLRSMLERLVGELDGDAIAPPESERASTAEWIRIPPPHELLANWWRTAVPGDFVVPEGWIDGQVEAPRSTSPVLWMPAARDGLSAWIELAWEAARVDDLWLVWRTLESPGSKLPASIGDGRLDAWLRGARGSTREVTPESRWRSTFPRQRPEERAGLSGDRLYLEASLPIELAPTPSLAANRYSERRLGDEGIRRTPLDAIYPLVGEDTVVLGTGSEAIGVSLEPPFAITWSLRSRELGYPRSWPALLLHSIVPVAWKDRLIINFRSSREEHKNGLTNYLIAGGQEQLQLPYHRPFELELESSESGTTTHVHRHLDGALPDDATPCGPPLVRGDRIYLAYFQGFREVELHVLAYDLAGNSALWDRFVGAYEVDWLCDRDLRNYLPEVFLDEYAGELLVHTNQGFLFRLGSDRGDWRGAFCYPRHELEELFVGVHATYRGLRMQGLPDPRPRYPGPSLILERGAGRAPLWVVLPADARHVIAIDLARWELAWTQPVPRQTQLLGGDANEILLLDNDIAVGSHELELRRLDPETGRHRELRSLVLACRESKRLGGEPDPAGPLLRGVPRRVGGELWVPTLRGLEVFDLTASGTEPLEPTRVWKWPDGAVGGTAIPLGPGRLLTVHRGDEGLMTQGFLELFRVLDE